MQTLATPATVGTTGDWRFNFNTQTWTPARAPLTAGQRVRFNNTGKTAKLVAVTDRVFRNGAHAWDRWTLVDDAGNTFSATTLFFNLA